MAKKKQKNTWSLWLRRWLMGRGVLCGQIHTDTRITKRHNAAKPNRRTPAERILSPPNDMELPMSFEPSSTPTSHRLGHALEGTLKHASWTIQLLWLDHTVTLVGPCLRLHHVIPNSENPQGKARRVTLQPFLQQTLTANGPTKKKEKKRTLQYSGKT